MSLEKIRLVRQALSGKVMIARFGKDQNLALEHKEVEQDFMAVLDQMCDKNGIDWSFEVPNGKVEMTLRRVKA